MLKNYHFINLGLGAVIIIGIAIRFGDSTLGNGIFLFALLIGYFYKTWVITQLQKQIIDAQITIESHFLMQNQLYVNLILMAIIVGGLILIYQSNPQDGIVWCAVGLFFSFSFKSWLIERYQMVLPNSNKQ